MFAQLEENLHELAVGRNECYLAQCIGMRNVQRETEVLGPT